MKQIVDYAGVWSLLFLLSYLSVMVAGQLDNRTVTYDGYNVISVQLKTLEHHKAVRDALEEDLTCRELNLPHELDGEAQVLCPPDAVHSYRKRMASHGLESNVVNSDFGRVIRETRPTGRSLGKRQASTISFDDYQRYDTIVNWMQQVAAENPDFITLIDMGSSNEGRKIYALKIGTSPLGADTRYVWMDGGIHAREWIAVSTTTFLADQLIKTFKATDLSPCQETIKLVDWYVAPILNPDGYEFSHTDDRLWRKNRRNNGGACAGVDLNRNFGGTGYGVGASTNPCSEIYMGPSENSEPETVALQSTLLSLKNNIRVYLTFHSFAQSILTSFGYTSDLPTDINKLNSLGNAMSSAIECKNSDRVYDVYPAAGLYPAGGASDDWAKIEAKIPYSYTVELPDKGNFGFVLPASFIKPVGEEWWNAMPVVAQEANKHPLGADPASST